MVDVKKRPTAKAKRIDGDSHFFPPVDFTGVAGELGVSEQALDMLLRDSTMFSDREARRGGFKASAAGKAAGAVNPTAATTSQQRGPIGHGIASQRVKLLPDTGFDMQVLIADGIFANPFGSPIERTQDPGLRLALSMSYNNATAKAQAEYPGELIGTGIVPFGGDTVEACAREARRAVGELGLKAITINGNWRGQNWDSVELYPFWEAMNDLGVPLYVHGNPFQCQVNDHIPTTFTLGWERMRRMHVSNYLGFAFEYMMAMASLTLGGVLKEFPNLRFAFFEAGGSWLPWIMYTLDRVYAVEPQCARCEIEPSQHILESCVVAVEPDEQAIVGAISTIGSKNFIVGSDYPHPPSTYPNTAAGIEEMEGLSAEAKDDILGRNLVSFFKLA
ncbi:MAG: amidohydrolase [Chloroflexi bacterium]|nr:amidohydrolase [Chloroflexota bacterium]